MQSSEDLFSLKFAERAQSINLGANECQLVQEMTLVCLCLGLHSWSLMKKNDHVLKYPYNDVDGEDQGDLFTHQLDSSLMALF